jgi:Na+/H+ antiporter NhaC
MNLYAITAVLLTAYSIARGYNPPAMAQAQARTDSGVIGGVDTSVDMEDDNSVPRAINMALPIIALVLAMPIGLYFTGNGDLFAGSGSKSVLWASLAGLAVISVLALVQRNMNLTVLTTTWMQGAGRMLPLATIMLLSLALGSVAKELGTGIYIAGLIGDSVAVWLLPVIVFVTSGVIAFSVGTSWGTFSIMLPIAIPVAAAMGAEPALFVAAVLSGGIFGDHASPISDTTIVSSLASGTEHIDHVKTQMPYAMSAGAISAIGFILLGIVIL